MVTSRERIPVRILQFACVIEVWKLLKKPAGAAKAIFKVCQAQVHAWQLDLREAKAWPKAHNVIAVSNATARTDAFRFGL